MLLPTSTVRPKSPRVLLLTIFFNQNRKPILHSQVLTESDAFDCKNQLQLQAPAWEKSHSASLTQLMLSTRTIDQLRKLWRLFQLELIKCNGANLLYNGQSQRTSLLRTNYNYEKSIGCTKMRLGHLRTLCSNTQACNLFTEKGLILEEGNIEANERVFSIVMGPKHSGRVRTQRFSITPTRYFSQSRSEARGGNGWKRVVYGLISNGASRGLCEGISANTVGRSEASQHTAKEAAGRKKKKEPRRPGRQNKQREGRKNQNLLEEDDKAEELARCLRGFDLVGAGRRRGSREGRAGSWELGAGR
ncbi:hypothetical protein IEQ34_010858 [Dendrobium chrysotoxum]|uniref:Uncharacterized protein n=1 Tax=Dendrobium chrysotoxum TaxID=161865 RepID=A0AAV7GVT8_DENCH|nr:hypothetical protein IEQ34_010858 [Dendrobium chrysotoxum]